MAYQRHDIEQIEGIGPSRGEAMRGIGIAASEDLLAKPVSSLGSLVAGLDGFPHANLRLYRAAAELMQVSGLTGQHAEALCIAGRRTLQRLAAPTPETVVRELELAVQEGIIPLGVDTAEALRWQKRALMIALTGTVAGVVVCQGAPVADVEIDSESGSAVTDAAGKFWLPSIPYGDSRLTIRGDGYIPRRIRLSVIPGQIPVRSYAIEEGQVDTQPVDESAGESIRRVTEADRLVFVDTTLAELPDGAPLSLRHRYRDGRVKLMGLHRRRDGYAIEIPRIAAPGDTVPSSAVIGSIFIWEGGTMVPSTKTILDIRRESAFHGLIEAGINPTLTRY